MGAWVGGSFWDRQGRARAGQSPQGAGGSDETTDQTGSNLPSSGPNGFQAHVAPAPQGMLGDDMAPWAGYLEHPETLSPTQSAQALGSLCDGPDDDHHTTLQTEKLRLRDARITHSYPVPWGHTPLIQSHPGVPDFRVILGAQGKGQRLRCWTSLVAQ